MEALLLVAFRTRCCLKRVLPLSDKRSLCAKASKLVQCGWGVCKGLQAGAVWVEGACGGGGEKACPRAVPGTLSGASGSLSLSWRSLAPVVLTQAGASGALPSPRVPPTGA